MMETSYDYMSDFQFAGKVLTTIISTPRTGFAVGDAGIKAVGSLKGMPAVDGLSGAVVESMDADHAMYRLSPDSQLQIGQQLYLIPAQQDAMVSRWDRFVGIRDGKVEAVWDIEARGCHN
jgi:D-serine deaminase-like pyridoxal phosphate-dependent protein